MTHVTPSSQRAGVTIDRHVALDVFDPEIDICMSKFSFLCVTQ